MCERASKRARERARYGGRGEATGASETSSAVHFALRPAPKSPPGLRPPGCMPRLKPWDRKAETGGVPPVNELIAWSPRLFSTATPQCPRFAQLTVYLQMREVFLKSVEIVLENHSFGEGRRRQNLSGKSLGLK
jgi:hypothetical protein